ncbi:MAG: OmpH family outer membrane protein [Chitinophagaceae bacterium]|jgi:outer membrane protein|nr:OmpH family outer membrane protein [Chitinophagaceae bacterium]
MKKGMIIWNVVLSVLSAYFLFQFVSGGAAKTLSKAKATPAGPFKMAYFEMDSVEANFELVKELKDELLKKEQGIEQEMQKMANNMQQRYNYYQQQANTGLMNQSQSDAAGRELRNLDEQMKNRKQALDAEYGDFVMRRQNEIKAKIEEYLREYNNASSYTYIVSYEPGLFYYKDTAYNITADLVKGLNERYKPAAKK